LDSGPGGKWTPRKFEVKALKPVVNKWQTFMLDNNGWNALYMENHDQGRTVSRYASDAPEFRTLSSKMIGTHLALQSGTVFVFQGQELAMANVPRDWPMSKYKDIECVNHWKTVLRDHPDDKALQERTLKQYRLVSRDNGRTPMQWSKAKFAGFSPEDSTAEPWMDVHPDFEEWNAANQVDDPESAYNYWKALLALRKKEKEVFVYGGFEMVDMEHESVVAYVRTSPDGNGKALVVTSFDGGNVEWSVPEREKGLVKENNVVLGNYKAGPKIDGEKGVVSLRPYEAFVALI